MRILIVLMLVSISCKSQDKQLEIFRSFDFDSIGKESIYDKAMLWCSERFVNSKDAIHVNDKSSGIIAGKGSIDARYYVPKKNNKDSSMGLLFSKYLFDWTIQTKDGKVRIGIKNIEVVDIGGDHFYVSDTADVTPVVFGRTKEKVAKEWRASKVAFIKSIQLLYDDLYSAVAKKDEW